MSADFERAIAVPVGNGRWVIVSGPFPLTEAEWDQFTETLKVMQQAIVTGGAS